MEWVRGGHWYPERRASSDGSFDHSTMDDGRVAVLAPLVSGRGAGHMFPTWIPASELEASDWWDEVGTPAGLEAYELDPSIARNILAAFQRFIATYPFEPAVPVLSEVDEGLCELLERWGPLEALPGVVPEPLTLDPEALRTVRLRSYHLQIRDIAVAFNAVETRVGNRKQLSEQLAEDSRDAFRDVELYLRFEPEGVVFDPAPRSLRAYLWRYLVGRWGRSPHRLCKLCGARFEVPFRQGKPPLFCEQHRNPRSRKRAERLSPPRSSEEE